MKTTAYLRVSTDAQDQASQRQQVTDYARSNGLVISAEVCDTASGAVPWQERQLAALLRDTQPGDCIIVSEVSRLARSIVGVLTALQLATERGIMVIVAKNNLRIDGSMPAKIVVTVFAMAAEIERELIRERTKAALQARKASGKPIGRQPGALGTSKCAKDKELIQRLLTAQTPKRAIARMLGVSPTTLYTYLDNKPTETEGKTP